MVIMTSLVTILAVMVVLGSAIPILWPMITATSDNISAMEGDDAGTGFIQSFWPVIILIIGIGVGIGLLVYGLKKFGLLKGRGLG